MASLAGLPRVERATGLKLFWFTMWARAYPRIIGSWRELSWTFFDVFLPLIGTISYIFVYKALEAPEEYIGFVVVGGAMTSFWLNVLWAMASQLYWDKDAGNLELYVVSPGPVMGILAGMAVGGMIWTSLRAATILIVCSLLFHVNYSTASLALLIPVFILTMLALYGMGMMFASIFLAAGREAWHISNLLQEPIYLASGFYFPVRALGSTIAVAASIIPLTLGLDAMRQVLFVGDPTLKLFSVQVEMAVLAVLSIIFIGAAKISLERLEKLGRSEGRLIERRR